MDGMSGWRHRQSASPAARCSGRCRRLAGLRHAAASESRVDRGKEEVEAGAPSRAIPRLRREVAVHAEVVAVLPPPPERVAVPASHSRSSRPALSLEQCVLAANCAGPGRCCARFSRARCAAAGLAASSARAGRAGSGRGGAGASSGRGPGGVSIGVLWKGTRAPTFDAATLRGDHRRNARGQGCRPHAGNERRRAPCRREGARPLTLPTRVEPARFEARSSATTTTPVASRIGGLAGRAHAFVEAAGWASGPSAPRTTQTPAVLLSTGAGASRS